MCRVWLSLVVIIYLLQEVVIWLRWEDSMWESKNYLYEMYGIAAFLMLSAFFAGENIRDY